MTKKQITELNRIVNQIPAEKRTIAKSLVQELTFMSSTLDDLKLQVQKHGTVELYENGKQRFLRENPAVKSYSTLIARYSALYKQLVELMPKTAPTPPGSELLDFINQM